MPDPESFDEFICRTCIAAHSIFRKFPKIINGKFCISSQPETSVEKYLKEDWRAFLCICEACNEAIEASGFKFIRTAPIMWEPEKDEERTPKLPDIDKVVLDIALLEYNKLKARFFAFFSSAAQSDKVITKEVRLSFKILTSLTFRISTPFSGPTIKNNSYKRPVIPSRGLISVLALLRGGRLL